MLELMYITNNPDLAKIADESGVDRVWIDLETLGKDKRQHNLDSVKSHHSIGDVKRLKPLLQKAKLQVRVNPINENSEDEIDAVITYGADIIMLPYYKTVEEVRTLIRYVNNRAMTVLLLETKEANDCLADTLLVPGVDEVHIGLNDLHLSYKKEFMFELLADGTVEEICKKIKSSGKKYGFGGIARLGGGLLPAEKVIAEHYRLGSSRAILSRSFCNPADYSSLQEIRNVFDAELKKIRRYEAGLLEKDENFFVSNQDEVKCTVAAIAGTVKGYM